ncbi:uncharacterized protein LOC119453853 [Dermacentor silvarum]|uniref:uncharacterized protein LOC119453853 n=1 Tax=Dermacentor silvarum TaxID=543639 RepID=UPI001896D4AF|nr:uncharacterized protein LOC119453853 [Dermacentor silvarum]
MITKFFTSTVLLLLLCSLYTFSKDDFRDLSEENWNILGNVRKMLNNTERLLLYLAVNGPVRGNTRYCWSSRRTHNLTRGYKAYRHLITFYDNSSSRQLWGFRTGDYIVRARHGHPGIFLIATYRNGSIDRDFTEYYTIVGADDSCFVMRSETPSKQLPSCFYWVQRTIEGNHSQCDQAYLGNCFMITGQYYNLSDYIGKCDFSSM